jgi:nucleotide-binding universal stress UspA family protein
MSRSILVPLDGSPFAEQALPLATAFGVASGAALRLVTVHRPPPLPPAAPEVVELYAQADLAHRREEEKYLELVATRMRREGGLTVTTAILDGAIVQAVAEQARKIRVWLIAMTTHGRGRLARVFLGSVADGLIRRSTAPVLLVRPTDGAPPFAPEPGSWIVLPLDGSELSETVLAPASDLARDLRLGLRLVHVVEPPSTLLAAEPLYPTNPPLPGEELVLESLLRQARDYLSHTADLLRSRGLTAEFRVVINLSATDALLDEAHAPDAAFVAMSTQGHGGIRRLLIGSVADKVVRAAERPVLVVRPPNRATPAKARPAGAGRSRRRSEPA